MFTANLWSTIHTFLNHPLGRRDKYGTLIRMLRWQIGSRILDASVAVPFIDDLRLIVRNGMHAATANVYVGLMEFEDMAFVLHFMRPGDMFYDIGANVGVYSILAASRGSHVLAVEPIPSTYEQLLDNIFLNRFLSLIEAKNFGVGGRSEKLCFTTRKGAMNHVLGQDDSPIDSIAITVHTLDEIAQGRDATMIKIDVEGFEWEVVCGAKEQFKNKALQAVLIELNGLGGRYGFKDNDIHKRLLSFGFHPVRYDPFFRKVMPLLDCQTSGNTLYIRDSTILDERLKNAKPILWRGIHI